MNFLTVERTAASADFFDAAARGELRLLRCASCGALRIARRTTCRVCGTALSEPVAASGLGSLVTWALHPGPEQGLDGQLFGIVELEEGPWLESSLVDVAQDQLSPGLPLVVVWVRGERGEMYPAFGPREAVR